MMVKPLVFRCKNRCGSRVYRGPRRSERYALPAVLLAGLVLLVGGQQAIAQGPADGARDRQLVVDLEFRREPLSAVLAQIQFLAEANFRIVGRDVPITATLQASNFDDAMEQLSEQTGFLAVKRGESWTVYSVDAELELQETGVQTITYLFRCRYARAADLADIIEGRNPRGFPKPRPLLDAEQYAYLQTPVEEVPMAIPVAIDLADADAPGRGIRLPLGRTQYELVPHLNGVLIKGPLSEVRQAVDFLRVIDRPMPLVLIELLIVQYFHGDQFSWRFDLANGQMASGYAPRVNQFGEVIGTSIYDAEKGTPPGPGVYPFGPRPWGVNVEQVGLSAATGGGPLAFSAVGKLTSSFKHNVRLLVSKNQARVVTNPHIAVISGHEGTIELDEIFNFTTSTIFPTAGATTVGEREELNSKTTFTVTPTVVSSDWIHLAINSQLAVFVDSITGRVSDLPDQRKNRISTSIVLSENETLIIGGLVKEEATDTKDRIPVFSKIPIVGPLFRGRDTQRQFTETVIYITPHISKQQGFEDAYFQQIFEQMERLQDRGQDLIQNRQADALRAHQYDLMNEQMTEEYRKEMRKANAEHRADSKSSGSSTPQSESGEPIVPERLPPPPSVNFNGEQSSDTAPRLQLPSAIQPMPGESPQDKAAAQPAASRRR